MGSGMGGQCFQREGLIKYQGQRRLSKMITDKMFIGFDNVKAIGALRKISFG